MEIEQSFIPDDVEALDDLALDDVADEGDDVEASPTAASNNDSSTTKLETRQKSLVHLLTKRASLNNDAPLRTPSTGTPELSSRPTSAAASDGATASRRQRGLVTITSPTVHQTAAGDTSGTDDKNHSTEKGDSSSVAALMRVRSSVDVAAEAALLKRNTSDAESSSAFRDDGIGDFPFSAPPGNDGDQTKNSQRDGDDDDDDDSEEELVDDNFDAIEGGIDGLTAAGAESNSDWGDAPPLPPGRQRRSSSSSSGKKPIRHQKSLVDLIAHRRSLDLDGEAGNPLQAALRRKSSIEADRIDRLMRVRSTVPRTSAAASHSVSVMEPAMVLSIDQEEQELELVDQEEAIERLEVFEATFRASLNIHALMAWEAVEVRLLRDLKRSREKEAAARERRDGQQRDRLCKLEQSGRTDVLVEYDAWMSEVEGAVERSFAAAKASPSKPKTAREKVSAVHRNDTSSSSAVESQQQAEEVPRSKPNEEVAKKVEPPSDPPLDEEELQLQTAIREAKMKGVLNAEAAQRANTLRDEEHERLEIPRQRIASREARLRQSIVAEADLPKLASLFISYLWEPLEEIRREDLVVREFQSRRDHAVSFVNTQNQLIYISKEVATRHSVIYAKESRHRLSICMMSEEDRRSVISHGEENAARRALALAEWREQMMITVVQTEEGARQRMHAKEDHIVFAIAEKQRLEHAKVERLVAAAKSLSSGIWRQQEVRRERLHKAEQTEWALLMDAAERNRFRSTLIERIDAASSGEKVPQKFPVLGREQRQQVYPSSRTCRDVVEDETTARLLLQDSLFAELHRFAMRARHHHRAIERREAFFAPPSRIGTSQDARRSSPAGTANSSSPRPPPRAFAGGAAVAAPRSNNSPKSSTSRHRASREEFLASTMPTPPRGRLGGSLPSTSLVPVDQPLRGDDISRKVAKLLSADWELSARFVPKKLSLPPMRVPHPPTSGGGRHLAPQT